MNGSNEHLWTQKQTSMYVFHIHLYEQLSEASDSNACIRKTNEGKTFSGAYW
jgi:hypothetical protein